MPVRDWDKLRRLDRSRRSYDSIASYKPKHQRRFRKRHKFRRFYPSTEIPGEPSGSAR